MPSSLRRLLYAGTLLSSLLAAAMLLDLDDHFRQHYMLWKYSDEPALLHGQWQLQDQPRALAATGGELSGLTWSGQSNSLFVVRNRPAAILELDLEGRLLREIPVPGLSDPEAIVWLGDNRFAVAEERSQTLYALTINDQTQSIDISRAPRLALSIELSGNKGFEGLAYDHRRQRLYIAKEREPQRLYAIDGYTGKRDDQLTIQRLDRWQGRNNFFMADFSGLHLVPDTGHLLVLSDESALISELNSEGKAIAFLTLEDGFAGLKAAVPQAEGVAMDDQNTLYLLSEPDLFYRFREKS